MNQHTRAEPAPIPFIDVAAQRRRLGRAIDDAIARVLEHCQFILGPEVRAAEAALAAFCGARHAITCASGTDALLLPLMAKGIGRGDAVICPAFTFHATAEVVALAGRDAGLRRRRGGELQPRSEERRAGGRGRAQARAHAQGDDPGRPVRPARRLYRARRDRARREPVRASATPRSRSAPPTATARSARLPTRPAPASFRPSRSASMATAARCSPTTTSSPR